MKSSTPAIPNAALRFKPPSEVASAIASASAAPAASLSVTAAGDAPPQRPKFRKPPGDSPQRTVYVLRGGHPEPLEITVGLTDGTLTEKATLQSVFAQRSDLQVFDS